jgi:large repetitive protein
MGGNRCAVTRCIGALGPEGSDRRRAGRWSVAGRKLIVSGLSVVSLVAVGIVVPAAVSGAVHVAEAPSISQTGGTVLVGKSHTLRITATGFPKPTFTESGALPEGMTFESGFGSASISGTPAAGTGNDYFINLTASNSAGSDTEPYDITVQQNPVFPAGFCPAPITAGQYIHEDELVAAYPAFFGIDENNDLPDGVSFDQSLNNPDLGSLSGTAQPGSGGTYGLQYTADANDAVRNFHCKLVVDEAPSFTDTGMATVTTGAAPAPAIIVTGTPGYPRHVTMTTTGIPPAGLMLHSTHTAQQFSLSLKGSAKAGTAGDYLIHVAASNGLSASEDFVLVDQAAGSTPQTTSVNLSAEPSTVPYDGSAQTYTATVAGGTSPTGYVQFSYGLSITTVPLSGGSASFTTPSNLDAGDYTVTATYTGDAANASSDASEGVTVLPAPTALTLTGPTSTPFGVPVTYTATVACTPDCGTTPTGSVDFNLDGNDNPVDLVDGQATFTTDPTIDPSLANEVDATFTSFSDAPGDFAPSDTESAFYDIGGVNLPVVLSDGNAEDGTTPIANGDTVTVDPTATNEFSVDLQGEAAGGGTPPGPLVLDITAGSTDVTDQLGLNDGSVDAPTSDPGTSTDDYFWTLSPGDLSQVSGTSATVTVTYGGSDNFVSSTVSFTLDW